MADEQQNDAQEHDAGGEPVEGQQQEEQQQEEQRGKPNAEAQRYRLRLREVEGERDSLTTERDEARQQVTDTVRGAVAEIVRHTSGVNPDSLWKLGIEPADLLREGQFDAAHVKAEAERLAREHGLSTRRQPNRAQGTRDESSGGRASWSAVLARR